MKNKLKFLASVSLKRKIETKWFVAANILLVVAIIGLTNIDSIINFFGGDFNQKTNIYVIDNTSEAYDLFNEQLITVNKSLYGDNELSYIVEKTDKNVEELKTMLEEEKQNNIVLVFNDSEESVLEIELITKEYMDLVDMQVLNTALNNTKTSLAIYKSNVPIEEINKIYEPVKIIRTYLDDSKSDVDESMEIITTTVFPAVILPFFMLTLFLVQMIGAEVNDEKMTRGMEIIISNVSPKVHFFAKVIAGNLFVLIQGALLLVYGGVGLYVRKLIGGNTIVNGVGNEIGSIINKVLNTGLIDKLSYVIPLALILMILTFISYSLLAGILASMTTNTEDFQQLQTPIIIVSLVGYFLSMMAGMFEGSIFIKAVSFIPLISAILAPSLLVLGQIGVIEIIIAIILNIILNYLLIKYGLKIYKVGILNYSSKGLWKKMFKALRD